MNERDLRALLNDPKRVDQRIKVHMKRGSLSKVEPGPHEITGHVAKCEHNLEFIGEIKDRFNDWILVACYYASYHITLSLILTQGYYSKDHDAALLILIKHFYRKGLSREDIELLNLFDAEDILFYVQARQERKKASYSTRMHFDKRTVNDVKMKTLLFVNKVKTILEDTS